MAQNLLIFFKKAMNDIIYSNIVLHQRHVFLISAHNTERTVKESCRLYIPFYDPTGFSGMAHLTSIHLLEYLTFLHSFICSLVHLPFQARSSLLMSQAESKTQGQK